MTLTGGGVVGFGGNSDKDQDEVDTSTVTSGVSIPVSDPEKAHEALAGPDPEPMKEDQTGSDSGKLHVSLAGPNPEHMDDCNTPKMGRSGNMGWRVLLHRSIAQD
ncbi:hypothetical protein Tco_0876665, partial [Tanacetum coccineum]